MLKTLILHNNNNTGMILINKKINCSINEQIEYFVFVLNKVVNFLSTFQFILFCYIFKDTLFEKKSRLCS